MQIVSSMYKVYDQPIFRKFKEETTLKKVAVLAIIICSAFAAALPMTIKDVPLATRMLMGACIICVPTFKIIAHYIPTGRNYGQQSDDYFEYYGP